MKRLLKPGLFLLAALSIAAPRIETVQVISRQVSRTIKIPGEIQPYESILLKARVSGYVDKVLVDRGSRVRKGQLLVSLKAPEYIAQVAESESKVEVARSQVAEARARLTSLESTLVRIRRAAETPGAVSANELSSAVQEVEAARAVVDSRLSVVKAAAAALEAVREQEGYLNLTAPFEGVVTERMTHPGALAAANSDPLLRLEQISRLRVVVAVPEAEAGGIMPGASVPFTVPAYADHSFSGRVARISHSVGSNNRAMPVELEVANSSGQLAPGMYADVSWPVQTNRKSVLVPPSSVVTTTEKTFVIRVKAGRAEYVTVSKGTLAVDLLEIFGAVSPGDRIVKRATDEIRPGQSID